MCVSEEPTTSACAARPQARAAWYDVPHPVKSTRALAGSSATPTRLGTSRSHLGLEQMAFLAVPSVAEAVGGRISAGHLLECLIKLGNQISVWSPVFFFPLYSFHLKALCLCASGRSWYRDVLSPDALWEIMQDFMELACSSGVDEQMGLGMKKIDSTEIHVDSWSSMPPSVWKVLPNNYFSPSFWPEMWSMQSLTKLLRGLSTCPLSEENKAEKAV